MLHGQLNMLIITSIKSNLAVAMGADLSKLHKQLIVWCFPARNKYSNQGQIENSLTLEIIVF